MATTECPIGDCGFTGPVKSVEAHISGSMAGEHAGRVGREFREQLIDAVERAASGAEDLAEDVGGAGAIFPDLTTKQWAMVVGLAVLVLWWASRRSSGGGGPETVVEEEEDDQPAEATVWE